VGVRGPALELAVKTVMANPTVETLAAALRGPTSSGRRSPIVPIQPSGTQTPLFLVHPASGTVICYCALANHLGRARPIYGLQAAGIEDGLEPISDLQVMASEYVQAVRETQPGGPYLIAGWSAGGHIAFEMANQLAAQGQRVGFLGLLDSSALLYGARTPDEPGVRLEVKVEAYLVEADGDRQKTLRIVRPVPNRSRTIVATDWSFAKTTPAPAPRKPAA